MEQIKKVSTILKKIPYLEWLTYLVNAYLFYAIVNAVIFPVEHLFLQLISHNTVISSLLMMVFLFVVQVIERRHSPISLFQHLFVVLCALYLLITIWKSPSLLIVFGLFALGIGLYMGLVFTRERLRQLIPLSLLLTLPKVFHLVYHGYSGEIGRFVIRYEDWNYRQLWLVLAAAIYAALVIFFTNGLLNLIEKWQKKSQVLRISYLVVATLILTYVLYLSIISAYKVKVFSVSTYDIGIFTQMFESMLRDLTPMTTLERDKLLSHFAVHVSPIFYLMLPFYAVWPYLETLEVLQVLIVFSGVIPLQLILKKLSLPQFVKPLILLWFLVTPALTTAGSYRMHENCFLVPLLLWLIYAHLAKWNKRLLLVTLLTLMVKEDAFIYVVSVGLYFLLQRRVAFSLKRKVLLVLSQLVFPILYFGFCLYLLTNHGDGAMVGRFENFLLADQEGLLKVLQNILLNPTYTFASLFTQRKLKYLFLLFATQAFLPLMQKRWENYLFFIPLIVINLLSDYVYQADFGFQYSYGTNVLVFFTSLLALEAWVDYWGENKLPSPTVHRLLLSMVSVATVLSTAVLYSFTNSWYQDTVTYFQNKERYDSIHQTLDEIDRNQTILSFSSYTIALRQTKELYDIFYHNERKVDREVDVIVLPRSVFEGTSTEMEVVQKYLAAGYQESKKSTDHVVILTK